MFEGTDPKKLRKWLIVAAAVYVVLPTDLVPDFLGLPGLIDDLAAMALLTWFYQTQVGKVFQEGAAGDANPDADNAEATAAEPFDPYAVLDVPRTASADDIRNAYRERMKEYHPDKVAHLGEELQRLAHEKSQAIQRAYEMLRG